MSYKKILAGLLVICLAGVALDSSVLVAAADFVEGQKVRKVVKLTKDNFRTALNDPANPVWFLKFYAYWCGHCKRLAPVLDAAAPQVAGKMAIGKIDCTEEKKLCDEFKVRGYPTLKFSLDGEVYDYPLGRSEDEIVGFADRVSRPALKLLDSVDRAVQYTQEETYDHGVSFVCHDPKAKAGTLEQMVESSPLLQVCAQAARKQMAHAHFSVLKPGADVRVLSLDSPAPDVSSCSDDDDDEEDGTEGGVAVPKKEKKKKKKASTAGGFLCRLEANVPHRCLYEKETKVDTAAALDFVKVQNIATVTQFGPHNFHRAGRLGRALVIGVADISNEEQVDKMKSDLASFATSGVSELTEKYYFGWMDGMKWSKFLEQFDIKQDDLPRFFVLDVPKRVYWESPKFKDKSLQDFLRAVANGSIESKESGGVRGARFLTRIANGFFNWMPWSLFLILGIATLAVFAVVPDAKDLRPPFRNKGGAGGAEKPSQPVDTLLGKKTI